VRTKTLLALPAIAVISALMTGCVGLAWELDYQTTRPASSGQSARAPDARIDINTASLEELMKAPGMTHAWAARIIRYRPYHAKNDLLDKGIVSNQVYDRIKDYIIAHRNR
jgi:competence protein ComEA